MRDHERAESRLILFPNMKTILLIDDDPQLRKVFGLALRRDGYHVLEADSALTGLETARQHLPDLILTDINMPGGDGSTLLGNIRRDPELRSRQVVLMTGRPDVVPPRKGMEEGADDFLLKPVSFDALRNCVEARFSRAAVNWRVEDQMLAQLRSWVPSHLPHEFFTPLAGIIGLTEILRANSGRLEKDEVEDIHKDIHRSALQLHRTLRNYLLILELQGASNEILLGSLSPRQVEEHVRAGVTEAVRLNQRQEDIIVRVNPCCLSVKPQDLTRIVEELVENACKFSRHGSPVEVDLSVDGQLTITDKGRGLTAEEIKRIGVFQQFGRKTYEQQGLGLGLVLVQKLSVRYEAAFSMKSWPGEGTEVQVAFPLPSSV
jgi:signal transduction histidine kinase